MSVLSVNRSARLPSLPAWLVAVAALVSAAAFSDALCEVVHRWSSQEEYSHGFLIPFVSAWLIWTRRSALVRSIGQPSYAGVGLVALAAAIHVVGVLSATFILSQLGFILTLLGIALAAGGFSLLRAMFMPIAYLVFAIPLPYFIDAKLTLQLQLISSEFGVFVIRSMQIPVYLDGNIIDMGTYQLLVAEACSGLRYLYPLMSLAVLAAYLFQGRLWQRVLIFLSSIPISIGMNGLRIGIVGVLVDRWGTQMADETLHAFEGGAIFLACAVLLAGEMTLLAHLSGRSLRDSFHAPGCWASVAADNPTRLSWRFLLACLVVLIIGGAAARHTAARSEIVPQRSRFVAFPTTLGKWHGRMTSLDPTTEGYLKTDDYLLADYDMPNAKLVNFYVAYYASQREGASPHSPMVCLPGGGWSITQLERRSAKIGGRNYIFNRAVVQNGTARNLVYYWFDERGRIIADEYLAKWYLFLDSILKNRSDGALIRLTTQLTDGTEDVADQRLLSFMASALPRLTVFLPSDMASDPVSPSAPTSDTME